MQNNLQDINRYLMRRKWPDPSSCALLVIDMQKYFLPVAGPILENIQSVIKSCREHGIKVIFTRHGHQDIAKDGGMLWQWWGQSVVFGSRDWELADQLQVRESDVIIDKNRYSAFHGTDLEQILRSLGLTELIISGVLTNCCCETTARDAFVRDFRIFFISDATATINRELHLSSLKNLAFGFAYVLSSSELRNCF